MAKKKASKVVDRRPRNVFMVWQEDEDNNDGGYWLTFRTLEDAVTGNGDESDAVEVHVAKIERLGVYRIEAKPIVVTKAELDKLPIGAVAGV